MAHDRILASKENFASALAAQPPPCEESSDHGDTRWKEEQKVGTAANVIDWDDSAHGVPLLKKVADEPYSEPQPWDKDLVYASLTARALEEGKAADSDVEESLELHFFFVFLGLGSVLPSFVLASAVDYFATVFHGNSINFEINVAYNGSLFLTTVFSLFYLPRGVFIPRCLSGFAVMAFCFSAIPALELLRPYGGSDTLYWYLMMGNIVILGAADSFAQTPLFALTGSAFPPSCTRALMLGVAVCGTTMTVAQICTKSTTSDVRYSSYAFFTLTSLICFACGTAVYYGSRRHPMFKWRLQMANRLAEQENTELDAAAMRAQVFQVLRLRTVQMTSSMLVVVQAQEFLVVPSVIALAHDFIGNGWYVVYAILSFNFGDLTGRGLLASYWPCPIRYVYSGILLRVGLIVAICLCIPPHGPLANLAWPLMIFTYLVGVTTGYLATSVISIAPTLVEPSDRELTGHISVLSIFFGLVTGSALSFVIKDLLGH